MLRRFSYVTWVLPRFLTFWTDFLPLTNPRKLGFSWEKLYCAHMLNVFRCISLGFPQENLLFLPFPWFLSRKMYVTLVLLRASIIFLMF